MNGKGKTVSRAVAVAEWQLDEADDPADWDNNHSFLRNIDASLRCELCYVSPCHGFKEKEQDERGH